MGKSKSNRGHHRLAQLREQAAELAQSRAARSPEEQLAVLDERLGLGVGSVKERARLHAEIDARDRRRTKKSNVEGDVEKRSTKKSTGKAKDRRVKERRSRGRKGAGES
jgi:hypothetical protein